MAIKFGEIDTSQILQNEFRIMVLEKIVEKLINQSPGAARLIDVKEIREAVVAQLQEKYPRLRRVYDIAEKERARVKRFREIIASSTTHPVGSQAATP